MKGIIVACFLSVVALQGLSAIEPIPVKDDIYVDMGLMVTREEGKEACEKRGMKLVTVDTKEKNDKVLQQIIKAKENALKEECERRKSNPDIPTLYPEDDVIGTLPVVEDADRTKTTDEVKVEDGAADAGAGGDILIEKPGDKGSFVDLPKVTHGPHEPMPCSTDFSLYDIGNFWTAGYETEIKEPRQFTWEGEPTKPVTYADWMRGEPNNYMGNSERCLELNVQYVFEVMRWNDENCKAMANYICE